MKSSLLLFGVLVTSSATLVHATGTAANAIYRDADVIRRASENVIAEFSAVSGTENDNPYLRIQGVVQTQAAGASVGAFIVDKVLETNTDVHFLVRPSRVSAAPGAGVGAVSKTEVSLELPDLKWGKTYTFIVLNYTGGSSSRHTSVYTYSVPLFR